MVLGTMDLLICHRKAAGEWDVGTKTQNGRAWGLYEPITVLSDLVWDHRSVDICCRRKEGGTQTQAGRGEETELFGPRDR